MGDAFSGIFFIPLSLISQSHSDQNTVSFLFIDFILRIISSLSFSPRNGSKTPNSHNTTFRLNPYFIFPQVLMIEWHFLQDILSSK
jgi:hypothetical protein